MATNFDSTLSFGAEHQQQGSGWRLLRHPIIVLAHVGFRSAAIITYIFAALFTNSFIVQFLIIISLLSVDFWTVKNITGRLLVGLRWWNFVDAEGKNHWKFESAKNQESFQPTERRLFWLALAVCPVLWMMLVMMAFVTFKWEWMVIAAMGLCMNVANLYGYICCTWTSRQDLTNYLSKTVLLSMLNRGTSAGNAQSQSTPVRA